MSQVASRGAAAQSATVKLTGCGFDPHSRNEIFIYIYIFITLLWCRGKAWRWVLPLNTQCLQNSAESGERSDLALGSLCLPCCVRDTAWSWFVIIFFNVVIVIVVKNKRPVWCRGASKVDCCGFNIHSRKLNIKYFHFFAIVSRQSTALSYST